MVFVEVVKASGGYLRQPLLRGDLNGHADRIRNRPNRHVLELRTGVMKHPVIAACLC
jgi:hypothetical protein